LSGIFTSSCYKPYYARFLQFGIETISFKTITLLSFILFLASDHRFRMKIFTYLADQMLGTIPICAHKCMDNKLLVPKSPGPISKPLFRLLSLFPS
jgi:hypothetical protein